MYMERLSKEEGYWVSKYNVQRHAFQCNGLQ